MPCCLKVCWGFRAVFALDVTQISVSTHHPIAMNVDIRSCPTFLDIWWLSSVVTQLPLPLHPWWYCEQIRRFDPITNDYSELGCGQFWPKCWGVILQKNLGNFKYCGIKYPVGCAKRLRKIGKFTDDSQSFGGNRASLSLYIAYLFHIRWKSLL